MSESFASIVDFLTVCLYEDEGAAKDAIADWPEGPEGDEVAGLPESLDVGIHLHRWRPRRVLAEVAAKRQLLHAYEKARSAGRGVTGEPDLSGYLDGYAEALMEAIQICALPYADHDGYRPEWAPGS
jgi:hypothetical protein